MCGFTNPAWNCTKCSKCTINSWNRYIKVKPPGTHFFDYPCIPQPTPTWMVNREGRVRSAWFNTSLISLNSFAPRSHWNQGLVPLFVFSFVYVFVCIVSFYLYIWMQHSIHVMYFAKSTMYIFGFALSVVFSFVCVFECMSLHIFFSIWCIWSDVFDPCSGVKGIFLLILYSYWQLHFHLFVIVFVFVCVLSFVWFCKEKAMYLDLYLYVYCLCIFIFGFSI